MAKTKNLKEKSKKFEVFEVPESPLLPFEFRIPGEKKHRQLPNLKGLPVKQITQLKAALAPVIRANKRGKKVPDSASEKVGLVIIELFDTYCPGITSKLSDPQLAALMKAWEAHSQIDMGESEASPI